MRILDVIQGSPEWLAARASRRCASDAPAVMGASKYVSRAEFVRKRALGLVDDVSPQQQAAFDRGHAAEEAAREFVEHDIDDGLYPVTCVSDDDLYLASMDGLTMDGVVGFEHKLASADLVRQVKAGELDAHYYWQLEHQLMVTGAERIIFAATDGTRDNYHLLEYRPVPGRREALIAGWEQFAKDVAGYVHTAVPDPVVAAPQEALPAVVVHTEGQIVIRDNLPAVEVALKAYIARLPENPSTDQEFADSEAASKVLKRLEDALEAEEDRALASVTSVESMRASMARIRAIARQARLANEKRVDRRKTEVRAEIATEFRAKLAEHVKGLNASLCAGLLVFPDADWGGAMKAKRTVQGLRDGCDDLLTKAKLAANDKAAAIRANLDTIDAAKRPHLFADRAQLVLKDHEAVTTIVAGRVQAEDERLARERMEAKLREAKEAAEQTLRAAQEAMPAPAVERIIEASAGSGGGRLHIYTGARPMTTGSGVSTAMRTGVDEQPALRMGVICERLGFIVNAQFIEDLGIKPAARDNRGLPLFHEAQFQAICGALVRHITNVAAESIVGA